MRPGLLLPLCIVVSAVIHVVLLTAVAVPRQRVTHGQTMTVDLVTPDEVPDSVNREPPSEAAPAPQGSAETIQRPAPAATPPAPPQQMASNEPPPRRETRQARQQSAPQRPPQPEPQQTPQQPPPQQQQAAKPAPEAAQPGTQLPPDTLADQAERLSAMLNLPGPGFGDGTGATEATDKAKLTKDEVTAFRAHLKSCWKLPRGLAANEKLKMLIRVSLRRDGELSADPALIEGAAPNTSAELAKATAVRDEALRTIRQCAPYSMLPAEKYREWRVLDIDFSPDQMSNG
ncbi:MAG: hypothetical protein ACXWJ0_01250 [Xanthobacteraceae bacterium]